MSVGEDQTECPLCMEMLELDDINFFPCTCGYQICRFCWHRIRTDENGLCPACRKAYPEDPAQFKPLTDDELQRIKKERRQKDQQRKQKAAENRKHLANVRVVQKNLVFVVGLSQRLADPEVLKKPDYFGKFGKIHKVVINHSTSYAGAQVSGPSASAYVTYLRPEDALRAIQGVNNKSADGRTLKASLGTTKYCSHFLRGASCPKPDCMYLHELGEEAASFTKEEMQQGKHQEYEQRLYEQFMNCQNTTNHPTLGNSSKAQLGKKSSSPQTITPLMGINSVPPSVGSHESWPSLNGIPPRLERLTNGNSSKAPSSSLSSSVSSSCSYDSSHSPPLGSSVPAVPPVGDLENHIADPQQQHIDTQQHHQQKHSRAPGHDRSKSQPETEHINSKTKGGSNSNQNSQGGQSRVVSNGDVAMGSSSEQSAGMPVSVHHNQAPPPSHPGAAHQPPPTSAYTNHSTAAASAIQRLQQQQPQPPSQQQQTQLQHMHTHTPPPPGINISNIQRHSPLGHTAAAAAPGLSSNHSVAQQQVPLPLRKSAYDTAPNAMSLFSDSSFGNRKPKPAMQLPDETVHSSEIPDTIPVSSTTDWQAAFGFTPSLTTLPTVPADINPHNNNDDDLGFDPWGESSKALADLIEKEGRNGFNSCLSMQSHLSNHFGMNMFGASSLEHQAPHPKSMPPGFSHNHIGAYNGMMPQVGMATSKMLGLMHLPASATAAAAAAAVNDLHSQNGFYDLLQQQQQQQQHHLGPLAAGANNTDLINCGGSVDKDSNISGLPQNNHLPAQDWQNEFRALLPNINISFGPPPPMAAAAAAAATSPSAAATSCASSISPRAMGAEQKQKLPQRATENWSSQSTMPDLFDPAIVTSGNITEANSRWKHSSTGFSSDIETPHWMASLQHLTEDNTSLQHRPQPAHMPFLPDLPFTAGALRGQAAHPPPGFHQHRVPSQQLAQTPATLGNSNPAKLTTAE